MTRVAGGRGAAVVAGLALAGLVGAGLVVAAGTILVRGTESSPPSAAATAPAVGVRSSADTVGDGPAVRVRDPLLVVNDDGSASIGALLENVDGVDVSLMGVVVWVDRHRVPVNSTQMWLPVVAGDDSQVGAASDAGGFLLPSGISDATRADVEFRFDDGTCVLADVTAVTRSKEHRLVYPKSNRPIGPVTSDEPPPGSTACETVRGEAAGAEQETSDASTRHELRVTIRDVPAPNDPDAADAYEVRSAGGCSAIVWGPDSRQLGELVVSASRANDDLRILETFRLPDSARLSRDGTCEATLTISLPYAPRYVLGVGIEGRGIAPENAPEPPKVLTEGDSQDVVVVV